LTAIAGQKAVITRAKKAISAFKITAGRPVGVKVTLRKDRMYEFLDRFRHDGLCRACAIFAGCRQRASMAAVITRWVSRNTSSFVEIDYDKTETVWGMDIIIQTRPDRRREPRRFSQGSSMPFMN
jgi:large subunit ribosomal protein L5